MYTICILHIYYTHIFIYIRVIYSIAMHICNTSYNLEVIDGIDICG